MHPHKVSFILLFPREGIDLLLYFHVKMLEILYSTRSVEATIECLLPACVC